MKTYNYYGVKDDCVWHFQSESQYNNLRFYIPRLFSSSDLVWTQGPKGGVRLIHQSWNAVCKNGGRYRKEGYVTTDEKAMTEFCWIKLKAVTISESGVR